MSKAVRGLAAGLILMLLTLATVEPTSTVTVIDAAASPALARMAATQSPTVILVVDVSGSMDEKDRSGTVKIEGAKRALLNVLQGLPPTALVGLHAYPSDGNCAPGSTTKGLGPTDEALHAAITGLAARGGTPTGQALRIAADSIEADSRAATIVLVSDGESNCGTDPCEVAKQVASEGVQITVNTVGFQISSGGAKELTCIADATGGRYFDAGDSEALQTSIAEAAIPRLSIAVDEPKADEVIGAGSVVTVAATVRNIANQRVDNVQTMLSFPPAAAGEPENLDPGIAGAVRFLGTLAVGESRRIEWQYRVARSEDGASARIVVYATAANASPQKVAVHFSYGDANDLSTAGPLLRSAKHPAILGDSYSAGEGAGTYHPDTKIPGVNACHRSDQTYAMSLYPRPPLLLACSGATTENIAGPNPANHEAAQIQQLADQQRRDPVDLVLLTIGGNDVGFADIIKHCVLTSMCQESRVVTDKDMTKARDCTAALFGSGALAEGKGDLSDCKVHSISYAEWVTGTIKGIGKKLRDAYEATDYTVNSPEAMAKRGGAVAPIVVLAYPNLMPYRAGSSSQGFCSRFLSEPEAQFGSSVADQLNARIKEEVATERAAGLPIYFAGDTADALRPSHTICDAQPHAVREVLWRTATGVVEAYGPPQMRALLREVAEGVQQEQLHPTVAGYQDVTAELVRWSNRAEALEPVTRHRPESGVPIRLSPDAGSLALTADPNLTTLLQPGSTVTIQGSGFTPNGAVQIVVHSAPAVLGAAFADSEGRIELPVVVPSDLPAGQHLIVATGMDPAGRQMQEFGFIEVRPPASWLAIALLAAAGLLLLVSAPVLLRRIRRRLRPDVDSTALIDPSAFLAGGNEGVH